MFARHVSKALLASVTAGLLTFAVNPAKAEMNAPRTMLVRFGDLDLKSDSGKATLGRRIAYAAATVCGPADQLSYFSRKANLACEDDAIANANRGLVQVFARAGTSIRVAAN